MSISSKRTLALALAALALAALLTLAYAATAPAAPSMRAPSPAAAPPRPAPSPTPAPPTETPAPSPTPAPHLTVRAAAAGGTLSFEIAGRAPSGASEALLWLDTAAGREVRRVPLEGGQAISATVALSATAVITAGDVGPDAALDYWVAVRGADALLRQAGALPLPPEVAAAGQAPPITPTLAVTWTERVTPHFRLFAPPGSDGARDLDGLAGLAEAGFTRAGAVISPTAPVSISVYLVPRVFWQGGVAYGDGGPLIISYLDRNYAGVETWSYFVHEVTHALGAALLPDGAEVGGVLGEGLAVAVTGGHYRLEPIDARAAALAASDAYVPLCRLRYDFYAAQHESAYTAAASFVQYLIRTYGREAFLDLYRRQRPQRGQEQSLEEFCREDDARVAAPLGRTNAELERDWLAYLATITPTDAERRAWELTVRLYDTMRRYQELLDPPARVLPPPPADWKNDDAFRALVPARGRRAAALETTLVAASDALGAGALDRADALLDSLDASLAAGGAPSDDIARDYDAIAALLEAQARAIRLGDDGSLARTLADQRLAGRLPFGTHELLRDLRLAPVRLDVRGDAAEGVVEARGAALDGRAPPHELYRARFVRGAGGWLLASLAPHTPPIAAPPALPAPLPP